jgi:hypothetical protein
MNADNLPSPNLTRKRELLRAAVLVIFCLSVLQLACGLISSPTSTPVPTSIPLPTNTPTATRTPLPTDTPLPTNTPTDIPVPTSTPKPTNTPKPADTPKPTSTPTPAGYIYHDDFSSDTGAWDVGTSSQGVSQIQGGRMSFRVTEPGGVLVHELDVDVDDFWVAVASYPQGDDTRYEYGFIFRADDDNFYLARVSPSGVYALFKATDEGATEIVPWTESESIQTEGNVLILVCVGNELAFYVNGTLVFFEQDSTHSHGTFGLYMIIPEDMSSAEVQFDDFVAFTAQASDLPEATPAPAATPTPQYTWADYLYFDLVASREDYRAINGWYQTLVSGESIPCPSPDYAVHRPSYAIPAELSALRSIYDRYLTAIALVDGTGDQIGPLDRIQLLCSEGKNIGQQDMDFDMQKLAEAGPIFDALIEEVQQLR